MISYNLTHQSCTFQSPLSHSLFSSFCLLSLSSFLPYFLSLSLSLSITLSLLSLPLLYMYAHTRTHTNRLYFKIKNNKQNLQSFSLSYNILMTITTIYLYKKLLSIIVRRIILLIILEKNI